MALQNQATWAALRSLIAEKQCQQWGTRGKRQVLRTGGEKKGFQRLELPGKDSNRKVGIMREERKVLQKEE